MVFCFIRHNGRLETRCSAVAKPYIFYPYFPCVKYADTDNVLTFEEHVFFQEVWEYCEENRMNQHFTVRMHGPHANGIVVEVMVDPEHEALFKLRWV